MMSFAQALLLLATAFSGLSWDGRDRRVRPLARVHPVHVSSTQIDLAADGRRLTVTMRLFTDDLEAALEDAGHPVSLTRSETATADSALSRYLESRFSVLANGARARARVIGHEREEDATLVFVELAVPSPLTRVDVTQQVLLERYADQTNLIHLRAGTAKRSALLRRGMERATFTL